MSHPKTDEFTIHPDDVDDDDDDDDETEDILQQKHSSQHFTTFPTVHRGTESPVQSERGRLCVKVFFPPVSIRPSGEPRAAAKDG